ncbi:predicted protein [Lichtheimia corymbifera JMRC:FSU:9682]|uniref:Uncharacterized protein n=1 Tax=Lichtheimia corymbifera JMRC:FSU:9682 TaxID=1263082 RepID=A0A068S2P6_9FUNG|nr:predicted protein [Lichtheimia corymbifera JMRC:FSU:9682]CDH56122.1 predicted protein [Lichtheimia corymbifera JMRC:FSU:9682]
MPSVSGPSQHPQPNVYVMNKELKIDIPTLFDKKEDDLLPVDCILELEQCHKEKKRSMRYEEGGDAQYLDTLVSPRILKITEKKHKILVGADGPRSSPLAQTDDFSSSESNDDA